MTKKNGLLGALALTLSFTAAAVEPPHPASATGMDDVGRVLRNAAKLRPYNIKQCPPGAHACVVRITVTPTQGGKCTIKPEADVVKIDPGMTVVWKLDKPWAFDKSDGIRFKEPKAPFDSSQLSDQVWKAQSGNTAAAGIYPYGVKVSNGSNACEIDPGIWI